MCNQSRNGFEIVAGRARAGLKFLAIAVLSAAIFYLIHRAAYESGYQDGMRSVMFTGQKK